MFGYAGMQKVINSFLIATVFIFSSKSSVDLFESIRTGDIEAIRQQVELGVDVNTSLDGIYTKPFNLLSLSIFDREEEIALYLLSKGATLDGDEATIHQIAREGLSRVLRVLLEKQPSRLVAGDNVLAVAASHGHYDVCKMLLEHAQIHNISWGDEFSLAMQAAISQDHDDIARLLLSYGAPTSGDVFLSAIKGGSGGIVRTLIQHGADVESEVPAQIRSRLRTPLDFATSRLERADPDAAFAIYELVSALPEATAVPSHIAAAIKAPSAEIDQLDIAEKIVRSAEIGYLDYVQTYLPDLSSEELKSTIPRAITTALESGHDDIARILVERFDIRDEDKNLILAAAVQESSPGFVRMLFRMGFMPIDEKSQIIVTKAWESGTQRSIPRGRILNEMVVGGLDMCHIDPAKLPELVASMFRDTVTSCP